jgi:trigger factor
MTQENESPDNGTELQPATASTSEAEAQGTDAPHTEAHGQAHTHQHAPALQPELTREIEVEAPAEEVSKAFRTVVKRYQKLAKIPGFRPGKVPESLVRSRFGKEVRQEVLEGLVSDRFQQAITEQKLQPVSQPQLVYLQLNDGQPLRFKAQFEVRPEFDLTGYDTITVEKPDVTLSEAEYEVELARALDSVATTENVVEDRPINEGDWAEITFTGKFKNPEDAAAAEGEGSEEEPIAGEDVLLEVAGKNTLPAFTEALRGQKVGQELEFEASYPENFGEPRLAGKTVRYDVALKGIKTKTYPEQNDDLAKQMGSYESWEDFTTKMREYAATNKKSSLESTAKEKMLQQLIERYDFPVPEVFVQQQIDARLDRGLRALAQQGMSEEQMRQLDFHRLRDAQRDQAVQEVKASILLDKVAEAENVTVTDDELERELLMLSIQSREPLDTLRQRMTQDGSLQRVREQMRREKTGTVLYEKLAK